MHVFVKQVLAGQPVRTLPGKGTFGVGQQNVLAFALRNGLPDQVVEPAVATETQRVQIARRPKVLLGLLNFAQRQSTFPLSEAKFGKAVINLRRLVKQVGSLPIFS